MSSKPVDRLNCAIATLFSLRGETERKFRVALLNATAADTRFPLAFVFGAICSFIAIPWVSSWGYLLAWFLAVIFYPVSLKLWRRKNLKFAQNPDNAGAATARAIMMEVPFHLLWLLYVPMCWKNGDAANNAFLTIFMMGSVTSAVRLYGPCYLLSLPVIAIFLPFCAIFSLQTGAYTDFVVPILQIVYLGLLVLMALSSYRTFGESTRRLFTIEEMAKNLEDARDEAERANKAKSAFLASMSHELRTPLNAIIGFSDMIRQEIFGTVAPPKYREYADDIYASGQHLLCLINDVLDLSKIEAGKRDLKDGKIDLQYLADNAALFVRPQAQQADIEIKIDMPVNTRLVADERAISQVLVNFLSNAIKFSSRGDVVTIFARYCSNGALALGVEDHGLGMDAEGIKKAMEPYGQVSLTSRNLVGTGLGLPIAKALVEAHGAVFHIESAVGVGTMVWGEFPTERILSGARY